jgi:hypothetical protein
MARTSKTKLRDYPAIFRYWEPEHDYLWVECYDQPLISKCIQYGIALNERARCVLPHHLSPQ